MGWVPSSLPRIRERHGLTNADIGIYATLCSLSDDGEVAAFLKDLEPVLGTKSQGISRALGRLQAAKLLTYKPTRTRHEPSIIRFTVNQEFRVGWAAHAATVNQEFRVDSGADQGNGRYSQPGVDADKKKKETQGSLSKTFGSNDVELRLATLLHERIVAHADRQAKADLQQWAGHIDRMIRIDDRKPETIEQAIEWMYMHDDFWRPVVLSTSGLRKHFGKIAAKMNGYRKSTSKHLRESAQQFEGL